jgi:hypothetical protein
MNKQDIVREAYSFDLPAAHRAYKFKFIDSIGSDPMNKEMWLGMGHLIQAAIPDIGYIFESIEEDGEDLLVTGRFTGTFTNDFDLSAMGMGVIPATGQPTNMSSHTNRVSFEGDKIVHLHDLTTGPDAGLPGFLKGLSADMG